MTISSATVATPRPYKQNAFLHGWIRIPPLLPQTPSPYAHTNAGSRNYVINFASDKHSRLINTSEEKEEVGSNGDASSAVIPIIHGAATCSFNIVADNSEIRLRRSHLRRFPVKTLEQFSTKNFPQD